MQTIKTVSSSDVVCVALEVHLWSARIQLKPEELQKFNNGNVKLPDAAIASLGSVKIVEPEVIRTFERLKREAQQVLQRAGLPLFGTRAVPVAKFDGVAAELKAIKSKFESEALNLLATYDLKISEWRGKWNAANPGYAHLLDRIPKAESVFGRLSFDYHAYRVEPPQGLDDEAGQEFTTKLSGLRGEMYADAAREAAVLLESTMRDGSQRDYITPKTLGPFQRIATRFRDFEMLDPSAIAAAELIEATVAQAMQFAQSDKNNRISDGPLMLVLAMANTFAVPATAAALAERARVDGQANVIDFLQSVKGVQADVETQKSLTSTAPSSIEGFETSLQSMLSVAAGMQTDATTSKEPSVQPQTELNGFEVLASTSSVETAAIHGNQSPRIETASKPLIGLEDLFAL
jgi:hypothetical protein